MSRLDSFIRRMEAQRDALNWAAALLASVEGPVFELGLGNGRTYDHLRERFPRRDIHVLEREVRAHPDCLPDAELLIIGAVERTLPDVAARYAGRAALIHYDLGTGQARRDRALASRCAPFLAGLLHPRGMLVSSDEMEHGQLVSVAAPETIARDRCHIYAKTSVDSRSEAIPGDCQRGGAASTAWAARTTS